MKNIISIVLLLCLTSCGGYKDKAPLREEFAEERSVSTFEEGEKEIITQCADKSTDPYAAYSTRSEAIEKCTKPKYIALFSKYVGVQDIDLFILKYDSEIAIRKKIENGIVSPEDGQVMISRANSEVSTEIQKRMLMRQQVLGRPSLNPQLSYNKQANSVY